MRNKSLKIAGFAAIGVTLLYYGYMILSTAIGNWTNDVIRERTATTERVALQLKQDSREIIDSIYSRGLLDRNTLTEASADEIDSSLKAISTRILGKFGGTEGGFYFPEIRKFLGYDYPTSPPPKPVYGPPPRSYDIILRQIDESISQNKILIQLHQFDPAIFPLVTLPVRSNGAVIGCIWARVHIERELPAVKIGMYFNTTSLVSLGLFLCVAIIFFRFRAQLRSLRQEIERIEENSAYRIKDFPGVFGSIGGYINKMVAALSSEHEHRQQLERELVQKEKMATLGSLISGVVHELKTPLAIIKTRVQLWEQEIKKHNIRNKLIDGESFGLVVDEIDRLTRLSRRLLTFSKSVASVLHPVNVEDTFRRAVSMTQFNHDVQIISRFDTGLPLIYGDAGALEQVFINILNNAVEAMPLGGKIEAIGKLNTGETAIEIEIRDEGGGIPEEFRNKIFEPFFTTKVQGVGLGLPICKEIIASHQGAMEVFSKHPGGTIIRVELPITLR